MVVGEVVALADTLMPAQVTTPVPAAVPVLADAARETIAL
jgi:hypothetical protein